MKKVIYWLGVVIAVFVTIGLVAHRFYNLDMTQVRWFIEFWYIWLGWFVLVVLSVFMMRANEK